VRITRIAELAVPISSSMRNAVIDFSEMTASVVAVVSDVVVDGEPLVGFGFNSNGRYAPSEVIRRRLAPRVLAAAPEELLDERGILDPARVASVAMRNEKPGGHGERAVAAGVLDMAVWDLVAKVEGRPLWRSIADRVGNTTARDTVKVYAAGGYYYDEGRGVAALLEEMSGYLDVGYIDLKMKIGGADLATDIERVEAVLNLLPVGGSLAVDANGRFDLAQAVDVGRALDAYELAWYEEPCDPLDFQTMAALADVYPGRLATGENLLSAVDARNLLRYGGMRPDRDVLQMDPALSYGLVDYLRTIEILPRYGWRAESCWPHGGHQFNLHIAAGLGLGGIESYPGLFEPFGGFADDEPVHRGVVRLGDGPGIGFERAIRMQPVLQKVLAA
jgi:L-alanine-DL-glutamate epimerase-like enolase superfamily enzyme